MFGFVLLILIVPVVLGPLLGIIAFVRTKRIDALERSVASLEEKIDDLKRRVRAAAPPPTQAATPTPVAPQPPVPPPVPAQPMAPAQVPAPPQPPPPAPPQAAPRPQPQPSMRPPARTEPEPPPKPPTDWERWIGIRGAAVLGGIVLALAGLLFFQYSIQHGLITPIMRVVLGVGVGLFAIVASEWLRPRGYHSTPEGLAGAGVVVLYAAVWAGHSLYHLIPMWLCFGLMVLVTATCGLLAVRHASQLVAVLGLVGGFATPLLLRSDADRPIGLFGYVLLLDFGLLAIGRRRRWPWLSLLGLAGTALLQALWIGARMGPDRLALGLLILAVFAVVFVVSGFLGRESESDLGRQTQAGALILPFFFAFYFALRTDLGPHFWPVAILLAMLCTLASWVGKRQDTPWLAAAAAAGSLGVFAVWQLRVPMPAASPWESIATAFAIALIFHVFVELDPGRPGSDGPATAAIVAASGFLAILVAASSRSAGHGPWVWLAGWLALSALLYRHAAFPERGYLQILSGMGVAAGLSLQAVLHVGHDGFPPPGVFIGVAIAVAVVAQVIALARRDAEVRGFADHAAATLALIFALSLPYSRGFPTLGPALGLGAALVLSVLILLVATRRGAGRWSVGALAVTTILQGAWILTRPGLAGNPGETRIALALVFVGVGLNVAWPFIAGPALQADKFAWYVAALAGPAAFLSAKRLWPAAVGEGSIGLLPLLLGGMALAAVAGSRSRPNPDETLRKNVLVWFSAVAICFASVAIPLQLDKSWVTIGWALEGLALIALWRRLDHPGLKWFALAHLAAATARLFPTMALLSSYPRSTTRIVNWVLYTYMVSAAALFASARLLGPEEPGRARAWERELYAKGKPVGAIAAAMAGIFVVFVWINLAIADWFAEGPLLTLQFGHSPARDLTVSISWAIYALVLLGFGMARSNIGLRWLSLSFLVVTIGKVFLYDLGELRDLYRVVSLVGLAVSLLLVSLLYQRFVFRRRPPEQA